MKKAGTIVTIIIILIAVVGLGYFFYVALGTGNTEQPAETKESLDSAMASNDTEPPVQTEEKPIKEEKPAPVVEQESVKKEATIAWQPSHQDDTGDAGWHEYQICGDIVDRAMLACTAVNSVKCWDIAHGLTGTNHYKPEPTNKPAFNAELAAANQAVADYFISVHNDGGAPSGILGLCMPGDSLSRSYLERCISALCASTGLPNRGVWEVRLYSLEPERNSCPVRFILEIGDNVNDRDKLMNAEFRQSVAQTLANVVNSLPNQR